MSEPSTLVVIDLDRTTFNTHAFKTRLAEAVAALWPINAQRFYREIDTFSLPNLSGLRAYSLKAHLESYRIRLPTLYEPLLRLLETHDFVYPDALALIDQFSRHPNVHLWQLTVGVPDTQRFKIELQARELRRRLQRTIEMDTHIIEAGKGSYLKTLWAIRRYHPRSEQLFPRACLIDDNIDQFTGLPATQGLSKFRILRSENGHSDKPGQEGIIDITDLREVTSKLVAV